MTDAGGIDIKQVLSDSLTDFWWLVGLGHCEMAITRLLMLTSSSLNIEENIERVMHTVSTKTTTSALSASTEALKQRADRFLIRKALGMKPPSELRTWRRSVDRAADLAAMSSVFLEFNTLVLQPGRKSIISIDQEYKWEKDVSLSSVYKNGKLLTEQNQAAHFKNIVPQCQKLLVAEVFEIGDDGKVCDDFDDEEVAEQGVQTIPGDESDPDEGELAFGSASDNFTFVYADGCK